MIAADQRVVERSGAASAGSSQLSPTARPANASITTQGMQPIRVRTVKRQKGMRAMPAGSEMNVRMMGRQRESSTAQSP